MPSQQPSNPSPHSLQYQIQTLQEETNESFQILSRDIDRRINSLEEAISLQRHTIRNINTTQAQLVDNCEHLDILKKQVSRLFDTMAEHMDYLRQYQDQVETALQDHKQETRDHMKVLQGRTEELQNSLYSPHRMDKLERQVDVLREQLHQIVSPTSSSSEKHQEPQKTDKENHSSEPATDPSPPSLSSQPDPTQDIDTFLEWYLKLNPITTRHWDQYKQYLRNNLTWAFLNHNNLVTAVYQQQQRHVNQILKLDSNTNQDPLVRQYSPMPSQRKTAPKPISYYENLLKKHLDHPLMSGWKDTDPDDSSTP
jgi:uncharacterized coiled-coil protein SlyX